MNSKFLDNTEGNCVFIREKTLKNRKDIMSQGQKCSGCGDDLQEGARFGKCWRCHENDDKKTLETLRIQIHERGNPPNGPYLRLGR